MEGKLLLISSRPEDVSFWGNIADENGLEFHCEAGCAQVTHVREQLLAHPGSYVFWEADPPAGQSAERDAIEAELIVRTSPERVFALSDGPINQEPGLTRPPAFGHHILRRYDGPAPYLYSRLIASTVSREHFGLERFLPRVAEERLLAHSFERQSALQQVQAFLEGRGVNPRIIRIGVEATDELLMNALFDAPWSEAGGPYRKYLSRSEGFPLDGRERVTVRMAANEELIGISVTDGFGSLQRAKVLEHLCQDLRFTQYVPPEGNKAGAGLGLHRVNQQAVALLFSSQPGVKTEVTVFLNNSKSFREFRLGFCFFSILSGEA